MYIKLATQSLKYWKFWDLWVSAFTRFLVSVTASLCIRYSYIVCWLFWVPLYQVFTYLMSEDLKYLCDVQIIFCTALHELYSIFFSQGLPFTSRHLPFWISYIWLIPNNNLRNIVRLTLVNLFYPVFKTIEGFAVIDSIDKDDSSSTFIISLSDGLKPLLTSSIPNLHFYLYTINSNGFNFEVNPNSSNMSHLILLIDITKQNISLTNSTITNDHYFN